MANVFATRSGFWSNTLVWNTSTLPTVTDDVFANNFTVYIDTNARVLSIRTTAAAGINAGGSFILNNGVSLSADVLAGASTCLSFVSAVPNSATVVGNISGSNTASGFFGLRTFIPTGGSTVVGTVNVFGNIYGGQNLIDNVVNLRGVSVDSFGTINIAGNLYGGGCRNGGNATALVLGLSSRANIVGNVYGGNFDGPNLSQNHAGIGPGSNNVVSITGNVYAGNVTNGGFNGGIRVDNQSNSIFNIIGNVYGPEKGFNGTNSGIVNNQPNVFNIVGNVYGGNFPQGGGYYAAGIEDRSSLGIINIKGNVYGGNFGVGIASSGRVNIDGNVYAGNVSPSVASNTPACGVITAANTASISAIRAIANDGGLGTVDLINCPAIVNAFQNASVIVRELQCGNRGQWPVAGPVYVQPLSSSVSILKTDTFQDVSFILSNSTASLFPPVSSVRSGVVYNQGNSTGTLVLPDPSAVALDVPTDNTVGTAVLTPEAVWNTTSNTLTASSLSGTIGFRLNNAATVQNVGHLIAAYNS